MMKYISIAISEEQREIALKLVEDLAAEHEGGPASPCIRMIQRPSKQSLAPYYVQALGTEQMMRSICRHIINVFAEEGWVVDPIINLYRNNIELEHCPIPIKRVAEGRGTG